MFTMRLFPGQRGSDRILMVTPRDSTIKFPVQRHRLDLISILSRFNHRQLILIRENKSVTESFSQKTPSLSFLIRQGDPSKIKHCSLQKRFPSHFHQSGQGA